MINQSEFEDDIICCAVIGWPLKKTAVFGTAIMTESDYRLSLPFLSRLQLEVDLKTAIGSFCALIGKYSNNRDRNGPKAKVASTAVIRANQNEAGHRYRCRCEFRLSSIFNVVVVVVGSA